MKISRAALTTVQTHAEEGYPYEICGFLIAKRGSRKVTKIRRAINATKEDPRTRYDISFEELKTTYRLLDETGEELIGYYHSHPDHPAKASETDRRIAQVGMIYLIVSCIDGHAIDTKAQVVETLGGPFRDEALKVG